MSEGNGKAVIKLGKIGVREFQYDDDTEVVKLDVILVSNQWAEIDAGFRDEKNEVPKDRAAEHLQAMHRFACEMLKAKDMSMADAMHFLQQLTKEAEALKPFFALATDEESSSPSSSVTVGFSE